MNLVIELGTRAEDAGFLYAMLGGDPSKMPRGLDYNALAAFAQGEERWHVENPPGEKWLTAERRPTHLQELIDNGDLEVTIEP